MTDARATGLELEKIVLGAALSTPQNSLEVVAQLQARHFNDALHRKVFIAIHELASHGDPVELPSVSDRLKLSQPEEMSRFFELPDAWIHGRALQHYIDRLREESHLWQLRTACERAVSLTGESELTYEERVEKVGESVFAALEGRARDSFASAAQLEGEVAQLLQDAKSAPAFGRDAIPTGLPNLDDAIGGGLRPGTFNVLGARSGYGKTTLATDIFYRAGERQVPALYVSLESRKLEIMLHLIQKRSGVSATQIARGLLDQGSFQRAQAALAELKACPFYFEDGASSVAQMIVSVRRAATLHGVRLVVLDYLQLVENPGGGKERHLQVAGVTRVLKRLAADSGVAVLALSQLNRLSDSRPGHEIRLSDLRESDAIGHDADLVLFLQRPDLKGNSREPDALQVAKNRLPGGRALDRLPLRYRADWNSYEEAGD